MSVEDLEQYRKKLAIVFSCFLFGGIVITIALFVLYLTYFNDIFIILAFVFMIMSIVVPIVLHCIYSSKYKTFINNLQQELMPEVEYNTGIEPDYNTFMSTKFFSVPDRYNLTSHARSSYGGFSWFMHDYKLERRHRDKDGNVSYTTYAQGKFYYFDFKREFKQIVRVIEKSFLSNACIDPRLDNIETESVEFNKKFKISCTDPLTAFYILTPQIQEKIMEFEKNYKGSFYMVFQGSCLCIALDGVENYNSCNILSSLNGSKIERLRQGILFPKLIIDNFKLSGDKFNSDRDYTAAG